MPKLQIVELVSGGYLAYCDGDTHTTWTTYGENNDRVNRGVITIDTTSAPRPRMMDCSNKMGVFMCAVGGRCPFFDGSTMPELKLPQKVINEEPIELPNIRPSTKARILRWLDEHVPNFLFK